MYGSLARLDLLRLKCGNADAVSRGDLSRAVREDSTRLDDHTDVDYATNQRRTTWRTPLTEPALSGWGGTSDHASEALLRIQKIRPAEEFALERTSRCACMRAWT